jgi:PIN domain nuclease of toxin-antitoxin system
VRLLLDTHILLWTAGRSDRLPPEARALISASDPVFSAASLWEIAIKRGLGRADFRVDPARLHAGLLANGFEELPVRGAHASAVADLPPVHRDPFDRILVAQALVEDIGLLTSDPAVAGYPGRIRLVR